MWRHAGFPHIYPDSRSTSSLADGDMRLRFGVMLFLYAAQHFSISGGCKPSAWMLWLADYLLSGTGGGGGGGPLGLSPGEGGCHPLLLSGLGTGGFGRGGGGVGLSLAIIIFSFKKSFTDCYYTFV